MFSRTITSAIASVMLLASTAPAALATEGANHDQEGKKTTSPSTRTIVREGQVASTSGTTITLKGRTYTVDASAAEFKRRYGGAGTLAEIQVGDQLRVSGTLNAEKTVLTAKVVWDRSIHEKWNATTGKVQSVDAAARSLVLKHADGKSWTITLATDAKLINRKGETMTLDQVQVNDRVTTDGGVKNSNVRTVTGATKLRDSTQPTKVVPVSSAPVR